MTWGLRALRRVVDLRSMHGHPVHTAMVEAFLHEWGYFVLPEEGLLIQLVRVAQIDHVQGEEVWTWDAEAPDYYGVT